MMMMYITLDDSSKIVFLPILREYAKLINVTETTF